MNKYFLIASCLIFSLLINAQDNTNYLIGAVPEVNGKIVFHKTINVKNKISKDDLFNLMNIWAEKNYGAESGNPNNKVLLANKQDMDIACAGEKNLVFKRNAFVLDQAQMAYQLILNIDNDKCDVTLRNLKYMYSDSKNPIVGEELISDKVALNKEGTKLNRYYDKFRKQSLDSISKIFKSIDVYLNGTSTGGAASNIYVAQAQPAATQTIIPAATIQPAIQTGSAATSSALPGYKQTTADKIPGNIIKLLNDWTLITSGSGDQINVMTASWGGLGMFWEKPVSFCFLNPTRYSVQTMDKGDTYTISFYTEAYKDALRYCGSVSGRNTDKIKGSGLTPIQLPSGATAFSEAWMILECKKIVAQPISPDAVVDKSLPQEWSKDGYHKMYIGEILNVWIK